MHATSSTLPSSTSASPRGMPSLHAVLWLAATLALALASAASAALPSQPHAQLVWSVPPPHTTRTNLIDELAALPNHTILVRLLQRARLIPTLNRLLELDDGSGVTILAPTDDAIRNKTEEEKRQRISALGKDADAPHAAAKGVWEWAVHLADQPELSDGHDGVVGGVASQLAAPSMLPLWTPDASKRGRVTYDTADNINAVLRQQLLYHVLNYTLRIDFGGEETDHAMPGGDAGSVAAVPPVGLPPILRPTQGRATMLDTMHYPSRRYLHEPTRPGPIPHPPTEPPHPGAEDRGGLLGGEPQKVRIGQPVDVASPAHVYVGTDSRGGGGARILNQLLRDNVTGTILSIDGVLDPPPDFEVLLRTDPRLAHLAGMLAAETVSTLCETAHATFFLPVGASFDALSQVERAFLAGPWTLSAQERVKLVGWHTSGQGVGMGRVAYADRLREVNGTQLTTILGGQLQVDVKDDSNHTLSIDRAHVLDEDILVENGVVHVVDSLLLPGGALDMTVEKTLLALNASRYVDLMYAAGLEDYINKSPRNTDDPDESERPMPWTFLVPRDDAIDRFVRSRSMRSERWASTTSRWDGFAESELGEDVRHWPVASGELLPSTARSNRSKLGDMLRYHVAPQALSPDNLTDGMLLGTELRDWRLKNHRQRVAVSVEDSGNAPALRRGNGDVAFGDASVVADPVHVGPAVIYLISQLLSPPSNPIQTAVSSLSLSTFVATVFSAELDKPMKRAPGVTYLVPHNRAFAALGLAMPYLLSGTDEAWSELRSVVEYHAIDDIVYTEGFATGSRRYPTLEGSPIWAGRTANGTVEVRRGTGGRNARVIKGDLLTSTGVLHELDQVELPPSLDLTVEKLMRGAKTATMRDLMVQAGYDWILNGTAPPTPEAAEELERVHAGGFGGGEGRRKRRKERKRHEKRHRMLADEKQAYVVLCPTDAAFARINLTRYLSDPAALRALVQLHIVPSPADEVLPQGNAKLLPLRLADEAGVTTLLDRDLGGESAYGKLAFRRLEGGGARRSIRAGKGGKGDKGGGDDRDDGDDDGDGRDPSDEALGWTVGVAGARGRSSDRTHSANILSFGRESLADVRRAAATSQGRLRVRPRPGIPSAMRAGRGTGAGAAAAQDEAEDETDAARRGHGDGGDDSEWNSRSVGGVFTLDAVLQPYYPNWFYRWGWVVLTVVLVLAAGGALGYGVWVWKRRSAIRLPDALEGEEE